MKLIKNWREGWRFWSANLTALGALIITWFTASPDAMIGAWMMLPAEFKAQIPPQYMAFIGVAILVLGYLSRFVKQNSLKGESENGNQSEKT